MKKDKKVFYILLFIMVFMTQSVFASGGKRNGTSGAAELLIPVGARGIALGSSYVAGISGLESVYYNPAGLGGFTNSAEVSFSQMNYIAGIDFTYAGVAANMGDLGQIAFTLRSLDFGDIPVTTIEKPEGTGVTFSPSFITLGLTYANYLTDKIKAGVSFNLITEEIERTSATGFTIDAGIQYDGLAQVEGLQMGLVLKNFGPQMAFDGADLLRKAEDGTSLRGEQFYKIEADGFEMPSQLEIGLAYKSNLADEFSTVIATSFQNNNFDNDKYNLGVELNYDDMLFLRGGYSLAKDRAVFDGDDNIFGPSFGAGFKFSGDMNIMIDYAYRTVDIFEDNQVFGINIAF